METEARATLGIDPSRIYFREEIAEMWRYEVVDPDDPEECRNLARWFKRNFLDQGLKCFVTGKRTIVHGADLSAWLLANSSVCDK